MEFSFQAKIAARGYHVHKSLAWSNEKQWDFVTVEIETDRESKKIDPYCQDIKAMVDIPPLLKTVARVSAKRNIKAHIFLFKRRERKGRWLCIFYTISTVSRGLEIPLKLTFKSPNFKVDEKMKNFMINLYSYDYKAKAETDEDHDAEIHFMMANEGLDGDKDEDSEVVKPKVKRKLPKISESLESDFEGNEVVEPTFKRKPPRGLDTISVEDWDLRLCLFCQNTNVKKNM